MDRQSLLKPKRDPPPKNDTETFLVTTYNPRNPSFKKVLDRNKPILESSIQWQHISKIKMRHGSRKNKNHQDHLIRVRIPKPREIIQGNPHHHSLRTEKCHYKGCRYCPKLERVEKITSHTTVYGIIHPIVLGYFDLNILLFISIIKVT